MTVIKDIKYKNHYTYDSFEIMECYIKYQFSDCYCAVLHEVGGYLYDMNTDEITEFIKTFGLGDIHFSELYTTDFIVLEFNAKEEMEEYMFKVYGYDLYVKFYNKGVLYDENMD